MQNLDRRLEHFHEFKKTLIGAAQSPGEGVGVRVVLAEMLQLADVHLAHERGDILIVLIARFGLCHRELTQLGWIESHHFKF